MRIVSKDHDYYDTVQAYGQYQSNVYVRKQTKIDLYYPDVVKLKLNDLLNKSYYRWSHNSPSEVHQQCYIGFCGKLYPIFNLNTYSQFMRKGHVCSKTEDIWTYNTDEIADFFERHKLKKELEYFKSKENKRRYIYGEEFKETPIARFIKSFDNEDYEYLFHHLETPIFIIRPINPTRTYMSSTSNTTLHAEIIKDPVLKPYSFFKLFDAYQAFQEVSFYMEGVLGMQAPVLATVPDEYLLEAKGFNQWSFKKLPVKKRKRR